jgi:hypothetical protein
MKIEFKTGSRRAALLGALLAFAMTGASAAVTAQELAGSWSGGGSVSFLSGKSERAKCRASFSKSSATTYSMRATCATPSGRVTQSASLSKSGANRYRGDFHNLEYDTSGTIRVVVSGNVASVGISASKGSASLTLHR